VFKIKLCYNQREANCKKLFAKLIVPPFTQQGNKKSSYAKNNNAYSNNAADCFKHEVSFCPTHFKCLLLGNHKSNNTAIVIIITQHAMYLVALHTKTCYIENREIKNQREIGALHFSFTFTLYTFEFKQFLNIFLPYKK
jgi:hypothetical protein